MLEPSESGDDVDGIHPGFVQADHVPELHHVPESSVIGRVRWGQRAVGYGVQSNMRNSSNSGFKSMLNEHMCINPTRTTPQ